MWKHDCPLSTFDTYLLDEGSVSDTKVNNSFEEKLGTC
jgi:hypothetical protein